MNTTLKRLAIAATISGLSGCASGVLVALPAHHSVNPASVHSPQAKFVERSLAATADATPAANSGGAAVPMNHAAGMTSMQGMGHGSAGNTQGTSNGSSTGTAAQRQQKAGQQQMQGNMEGMDHGGAAMQQSAAAPAPQQSGNSGGSSSPMGGHNDHGAAAGAAGHSDKGSAAGRPGDVSRVTRTVNVTALDTMRFEPSSIRLKAGETIRFVVKNAGKIEHEFVLATAEEQKEHEAMMAKMPGMKHQEPNAITVAPGDTKSVVWLFDKPGNLQAGCHVPGHYPAGMTAAIVVEPAAGSAAVRK